MPNRAGVVVTYDKRARQPYEKPVWKKTVTFSVVSGDTTGTATVLINGLIQKVVYEVPDTTNNDLTSQLVISDSGGNAIVTSAAAVVENTKTKFLLSEPESTQLTLAITFSEDVGVTAEFKVHLWGI